MFDYIKPVVSKKPNTDIIHISTNNLTDSVKTINKVKKLVQYIIENDKHKNIEIGFSSISYRADIGFENEINDTKGQIEKLLFR